MSVLSFLAAERRKNLILWRMLDVCFCAWLGTVLPDVIDTIGRVL